MRLSGTLQVHWEDLPRELKLVLLGSLAEAPESWPGPSSTQESCFCESTDIPFQQVYRHSEAMNGAKQEREPWLR